MRHKAKLNIVGTMMFLAIAFGSAAAQCSNATVVGTYRYIWTGYGSFGAGGDHTLRPNGPFTPFAAVGVTTFNADGTSTNTDTVQLAGGSLTGPSATLSK